MVIVGYQKQIELLENARESGRMGHAYIFSGPEKIGKKTIALEWVSRILGEKISEGTAHPDFLFVSPLIDPKTGKSKEEITVDQIRELIRKLSLKPSISKVKAAIINEAHLMNSDAQNCLLKTLEEPPGDAVIILIARDSQRLLETIRSRCETLRFNFVSEKEMETCAKDFLGPDNSKMSEELVKEIVNLSLGRPGRMMEFIADEKRINKWREEEREFAAAVAADLPEKFAYVKKITDPENPEINLSEIIEVWEFHFRNLMLESLAGVFPLQASQRKDPCEAKPQFVFSGAKKSAYSLEKIAAILKKIHGLNVTLTTTNASPKLAIENFMLDL